MDTLISRKWIRKNKYESWDGYMVLTKYYIQLKSRKKFFFALYYIIYFLGIFLYYLLIQFYYTGFHLNALNEEIKTLELPFLSVNHIC